MMTSMLTLVVLVGQAAATPANIAPGIVGAHNFLKKASANKTQVLPVPVNPKNLKDWEAATQHCFVTGAAFKATCAAGAIKGCMNYVKQPPCTGFVLDAKALPDGRKCKDVCADLQKQYACVIGFNGGDDSATCNAMFIKAGAAETCTY